MVTGCELYKSKREREKMDSIAAMQVRDSLWDESLHWLQSADYFTETFHVCGLS